ncbi:hypothetical protein KY312_04310 [Candidatus Woesearchaeota archaeon]|nr:hypothetical protein [Candidatus Woesearchaeota archaeon]
MSLTDAQKERVEEIVKAHVQREKKKQEREAKRLFFMVLKTTPIPILIGIAAVMIYYYYYGWYELKKITLSWTIGVTLIATLYTTFINKLKNIST